MVIVSFTDRPQYQIDKRSMGSHHGQRVMVRTCNGLELRDPSLFVETSASELVESSVLFPSLDSRDELHPRYVKIILIINHFIDIKFILSLKRSRNGIFIYLILSSFSNFCFNLV